jgi:hypothetical protein
MKTQEKIKAEIAHLDKAFKDKLISTNDYCTLVHTLLKKLKGA